MRHLIIAGLLLGFSHPVAATETTPGPAMRYQDSNMILTLRKAPCAHAGIRNQIKDEYREQFREADLTWQGKQLHACWMRYPQDHPQFGPVLILIDETGDTGFLPLSAFRRVDGV